VTTSYYVLGTPLLATTYAELTAHCQRWAGGKACVAIDFTNTHIVANRRHDPQFRELTSRFDYFIPDGMPLVWCLNLQGAGLCDRVYGPTFMRHCVRASPAPLKHYFLGGSDDCVARLKSAFVSRDNAVQIVGCRHGYFGTGEHREIVDEINRLSPDFIWVGLGTPKQQAWIHAYKNQIKRGVILAVGFAFDVNAGLKPDAPAWMQRCGLTWLFRLGSEPQRLGPRYVRYNALFLLYLFWDSVRGRVGGRVELR